MKALSNALVGVKSALAPAARIPSANQAIQGALRLTTAIDDFAQEALNPRSINALAIVPSRGLHVWGARTMSTDSQWKYVNVRQPIIHFERSIDEGIHWVVVEPNGESVWKRVAALVSKLALGVRMRPLAKIRLAGENCAEAESCFSGVAQQLPNAQDG